MGEERAPCRLTLTCAPYEGTGPDCSLGGPGPTSGIPAMSSPQDLAKAGRMCLGKSRDAGQEAGTSLAPSRPSGSCPARPLKICVGAGSKGPALRGTTG